MVHAIVKATFENFDEFRKLHPAFANLETPKRVKDGLSCPSHPGPARDYKEKGWINCGVQPIRGRPRPCLSQPIPLPLKENLPIGVISAKQ